MRIFACLLATTATATAAAEPHATPTSAESNVSVGVSTAVAVERWLTMSLEIQGGWRFQPRYWVMAAAGIGASSLLDPAGSGQDDSVAYEGRVGVARLTCSVNTCAGLVVSLGFLHQRIDFEDGLVEPPSWSEMRDLVFGEVRGIGRLRLGRYVALEAALGARLYGALRSENTKGGIDAGFVVGLGLHASF